MTIATALLLTVLCAGHTPHYPADTESSQSQQATSGIIIGADIEGRLTIFDEGQRLVVELEKVAGRQLQVGLAPGAYEARLGEHGGRRMRFQLGEGQQLLLALPNFGEPATGAPPPADSAAGHPASSHHSHPLDARHRIEVRFGGWGDAWYDHGQTWDYSGSVQAAFGLEYLNFVRNDLGVGIGLSTLARANGDWDSWDDGGGGQATCGVPVVVRWYPLRRVTRTRSVEPYVTGGIGPVFGVDAVYIDDHNAQDWDHDYLSSGHVGTTIGGRLGGGMDIRLGSVFTIGVAGAWNWDAGFSNSTWGGGRPGGGEFSVALGWMFGR